MSRRDQRPTYTPPVPDDELSLEAILAEYGRGGRQPAPDTASAAEPAPAAPSVPESVPEPEDTPLSDVPDRVSLKDVMNQTVESVLEESEDGVLDEPVPLGQRLAALLHRFTERGDDRRRGLSQETEQLFDEPEDEPEPPDLGIVDDRFEILIAGRTPPSVSLTSQSRQLTPSRLPSL